MPLTPDTLLVIAAVLLALVPCAFFLGRRVARGVRSPAAPRQAPTFSRKPELIDELDTENMELTEKVRALSQELDDMRERLRVAEARRESESISVAEAGQSEQRDKETLIEKVRELQADLAALKDDLTKQASRNETLEARLASAPAHTAVRAWPAGHKELDDSLATEDADQDDETAVARLNRKLVLARNTIAEFLEAQHQIDEADARAVLEGGERDPSEMDEKQLRVELIRARRKAERLASESHMQRDVISALEGDSVELKRAERQLEEKTNTATFLQNELADAIEEVARLKNALRDPTTLPDDDDEDGSKMLRAISRSSD